REKANHQFCNILEPGNVGGHCIPVYPWFLINDNDVPLIKEARLLNDDMIKYYLEQVKKISPKGKVCIVGLSYRTGVKEKAYARSIPFIKILKEEGYEVYGIDEMYSDDELEEEFGVQPSADLSKMDVIVLFNKIESYEGKLEGICSKVVDVRNSLEANGRK
ncbi:hypothetical protein HQ545_08190, partial [Candidatus Woesearchaeota archaeon]|nr:hypothetical protein [Candidatus Woesearchaeota archaeon]